MVEHDTRLKKLGRRTAFAAGGVIALGGISAAGYVAFEHGDELEEVSDSVKGFFTEDKCKIDDQEKDYVRVLFPEGEIRSIPDLKEYATSVALENNLTLVRSQPFVQAVGETNTKEEVLEVLNIFGENFPFSFEVPTEKELSDFPFEYKPIVDENISHEEYQQFASEFLDNMHFIPREVVELSGVEKIKLVKDLKLEDYVPDPFNKGGSNYYSSVFYPINNTLYISLKKDEADKVSGRFLSSFSTAIDLEVCGNFGAQRDEVFGSFNPEEFLYGNIDEEYPEVVTDLASQLDIIRDKKNITKNFVLPHGDPDLRHESEIIQNKANLIASRIDGQVPHFYDYWTSFLNVKEAQVNTT